MTDLKQPSGKSAVDRVDSEHVKMFTQNTLYNETNRSGVMWAYLSEDFQRKKD